MSGHAQIVKREALFWSGVAFLILLLLGGAAFPGGVAVSSSFRVMLLSRLPLVGGGDFFSHMFIVS